MGMIRLIATGLAAASLAACVEEPPESEALGSRYRFKSDIVSAGGGKAICYAQKNGKCDIRVPPSVTRYGANEHFISAAVARIGQPIVPDYYFIVRDFDSPRADGSLCLGIVSKGLAAKVEKVVAEKKVKQKCKTIRTLMAVDETPSDCAVRGPFSESAFRKLRSCLCAADAPGAAEAPDDEADDAGAPGSWDESCIPPANKDVET
jgi:hypothetical protein